MQTPEGHYGETTRQSGEITLGDLEPKVKYEREVAPWDNDTYKRPTTRKRYEGISNREDMVELRHQFYAEYQEVLDRDATSGISTQERIKSKRLYVKEFINERLGDEARTAEEIAELQYTKALGREMLSMSDKTFNSVLDQMYGPEEAGKCQSDNTSEVSSDTKQSTEDESEQEEITVKPIPRFIPDLDNNRVILQSPGEMKARIKFVNSDETLSSETVDAANRIDIDGKYAWLRELADAKVEEETISQSASVVSYQDAAIAFASRMKAGVIGRKKHELSAAYETEFDRLNDALTSESTAELEKLRERGLSDDEIATRLADLTNKQAETMSTTQHEAMLGKFEKNAGRLAKLRKLGRKAMDMYANASTGKKIAAGIGIGVATAAVGVGVAATGGALAVAGGVGLAGARMFRAYSLSRAKLYERSSVATIDSMNEDGSYKTPEEIIAEGAEARKASSLDRIKSGDKKKKIALGVTAVSALMIGGGIVHTATEHFDAVRGWFGGHADTHASVQPTPPVVEQPPAIHSQLDDLLHGNSGNFDVSQYADAQTISSGEGWYQTFGELGISNAHDQSQLLNNDVLMGKLANMGLAYPDASTGSWGLNMTANGKMPTDALKLIHDTAKQSGLAVSR